MGTRKERLSFPSFLHVFFSTSSTCLDSPPRLRTNAEKQLGTEDYSLQGKAKAFFKLNQ